MSEGDRAWLAQLPKTELHLHLEGAIPLDALWELLDKYGGDGSVPDRAALTRRFRYRDFSHFIETWVWKNGFLREYEDFTFIAESVARDLERQRIVYAEVFYSPGDFRRHGLEPAPLTLAIRRGLDRVPGIEVRLIADLIRDLGPDLGRPVLDAIAEVRDAGVIGIGIGGSEQSFPPDVYADLFAEARRRGFRTTAHAGEAAGPESVRAAVKLLEVDRVGHGTRAVEDPDLVDHLAAYQVPIELCPVSNVRTGVVSSVAEHPARVFFDRGIPLSINTDDPAMFDTTLVDEYAALMHELAFSRREIIALLESAIRSSWASGARKAELLGELRSAHAKAEETSVGRDPHSG